jgi:hypothetical protein
MRFYNNLQSSFTVHALALASALCTSAAMAQTTPAPPVPASSSVEDQLRRSSEGVGRFRGGFYGALGWGFGSKIKDATTGGTRPSGPVVDLGLYGLFNPIRDFADIEVGGGLRAMVPTSVSTNGGRTEYKSGFVAGSVYAGPVFRLGKDGSSALALGAQLELGAKVLKDSADPFMGRYDAKLKPSLGGYLEYQYKGEKAKAIYYTRLSLSKYDVSFSNAPAAVASQGKGGTLVAVVAGIKY